MQTMVRAKHLEVRGDHPRVPRLWSRCSDCTVRLAVRHGGGCSGPLTPGPGPWRPRQGVAWLLLGAHHSGEPGALSTLETGVQVPQVSHAHLERREGKAVTVPVVTAFALSRRRKEGQADRRRCCRKLGETGEGEVLPEVVAVARAHSCHLQLPSPAAVPWVTGDPAWGRRQGHTPSQLHKAANTPPYSHPVPASLQGAACADLKQVLNLPEPPSSCREQREDY